jgi:hypothetical protein
MSLSEKVEQLNREISATVERALSEMRRELSQRLRAHSDDITRQVESFKPELPDVFLAHEDLAPAAETLRTAAVQEGRQDLLGSLRESVAALDRARTQAEILGALLEGSRRFAERAALLLLRDGELRGWDGRGWHDAGPAFAEIRLQPDGAWAHLAAGQRGYRLTPAEAALLCSRLESPLPHEAVLLPLVLRDRVAAALYADRLDGAESDIEVEALQLLTHSAALAIETLAFRERSSTATLADLAAAGAAAPASLPVPAGKAQEPSAVPVAEQVTVPVARQTADAAAEPAASEPGEPAAEHAAGQPAERAAGPVADHASGQTAEHAGEPAAEHEPAPIHPEGGTELPGSPADRPAFLDDSLAYSSRHTTELPMPGEASEPAAASGPTAHLSGEPMAQGAEPEAERSSQGSERSPGSEGSEGSQGSQAPRRFQGSEGSQASQAPENAQAPAAAQAPEAPETPGDAGGRGETVLLPRPGFREAVPASWARPARKEEPELDEDGPQDSADRPEHFGRPEPVPPLPSAESFQTTLTPVAPPAADPFSPAEPARPDAGNSTHPNLANRGRAETAPTAMPTSGVYREPTTAGFEPLRSTPLTSGTPEVKPPTGVQGPGWAFATTRLATSSEESAHEEARRLARLLVSEIKLYNEEQVEAGRRNRDIYERLREDIDRSRQMYEERVEPRLAKSTDYFYQELVRILAAGDSKALGI